MHELILGGARSGKSLLAEQRARESAEKRGLKVVYLATAQALDGEMARRVAHHRKRRPAEWGCTEETPHRLCVATGCHTMFTQPGVLGHHGQAHLDAALQELAAPDTCVLVDCLTLWLSNLLFAGVAAKQAEAGEAIACPLFRDETAALIDLLPTLPGHIILVSNEVGWGIVPMHPVSRLFADEQGRLNQRVAAVCDQVTLVAAGLPLTLKSPAAKA